MLDVRAPGSGLLAPDGKTLFFTWAVTGVRQIWRLDGPQRFPVQLTGGEDATSLAGITPDGKKLLVVRDRAGEENPGLYLQDPAGGALSPIQHVEGVQTFFEFVTDDSRYVYFRANDVAKDSFAIYRYDLAAGRRELVFGEPGLWFVADHQKDGKLLLEKALGNMMSEFYELDPASHALTPLIGQGEREEYVVRYAATPGELVVSTPKLGDHRRLYRFSLADKKLEPVTPDDKELEEGFAMDEARTRLFYIVNDGGYARLRALDPKTYKEVPLPALPPGDHQRVITLSRDGRYGTFAVETATAPVRSFSYDFRDKKLVEWLLPSSPEVDTRGFAVPKLESYPARDGTPIPMFVRRPAHCQEPCPVIMAFHGGPEAQARPGLNVAAQMFVDAGFVFAEPNVRGSDGYGKSYLHADDGAKRLLVITDIEDASKFVRSAWAVGGKAPKVGVFGGSYGGYSALMAMTMFAGAYDAGVSFVGISNLLTFLKNTAPYRRALRVSEYGDPDKDADVLTKLSPTSYVERVAAPLFILQGATDPRVPAGESIQIYRAVKQKGVPVDLMIFPDEGHGARKRSNQVLVYGHSIQFFQKHLGGG
ncbi:MAG: S9 family peptidase [Polyangiaceae bacterium]|nr:S9 family peptidase [Polyangiaceae bacterium]